MKFPLIWKVVILGALLWWILGLNLFIYHIAAFLLLIQLFFVFTKGNATWVISPSARWLLMISAVYLFSILIHAPSAEGGRIWAAFYNLSFWVMGILLVLSLSNIFSPVMIRDFLSIFPPVAAIVSWIWFLMILAFLNGFQAIIFPSPLYGPLHLLDPTPLGLVESSLMIKPLFWDWFASLSRPRFNIFSPYATASGAFLMMLLMMLLTGAKIRQKKWKNFLFGFLFLAIFGALVMTLSRVSVIAFFLSLFLVWLVQRKKFFLWMMVLLIVLIFAGPWIEKAANFFLGLRQESTEGRLSIYRNSFRLLEGVDWILGMGIKPREEWLVLPLGSHSTFLSMLFKTGLVGGLIFLFFQLSLLLRWYGLKSWVQSNPEYLAFWQGLGWVLVGMSLWMLTDDIDAPQLVAFLYFSIVGIFDGFSRQVIQSKGS